MITYTIPGSPIPLARLRIGRNRFYDGQKELKLITQITLKCQHGDNPFYQGPLKIDVTFFFHIPKTHKNTKPGDYMVFRPDIDNLEKMLLDLGQGILYKEDCIIAKMSSKKIYDTNPRTEFTITELPSTSGGLRRD